MARTLCIEYRVPGPEDPETERHLLRLAENVLWRSAAEADYVEAEVLFGAEEWDVDAETVETARYTHAYGDEWDIVARYDEDAIQSDLYGAIQTLAAGRAA